jgi:hypothetical protein
MVMRFIGGWRRLTAEHLGFRYIVVRGKGVLGLLCNGLEDDVGDVAQKLQECRALGGVLPIRLSRGNVCPRADRYLPSMHITFQKTWMFPFELPTAIGTTQKNQLYICGSILYVPPGAYEGKSTVKDYSDR